MALIGAGLAPGSASAHQVPAGCNTNGIDLTFARSVNSPVVRQGDTLTFLVAIGNDNQVLGLPCNVTGASIGFTPPNPDGSENQDLNAPSAVTLLANQSYASLTPSRRVATYKWTVKLDPDTRFAYALARVRGTLHDTAPDHTFANVVKDIGFQVTNPKLTLDKIGSIKAGQAPQNVTYTYIVRNDSTTPVPMNRVAVSDDKCADPTYAGGDDGDDLLSNGEAWTFTCTSLLQAPGVYTNTATACAHSTVPGDTDRPVCSPPDTWTVELTPPPAPPPAAPAPPPTPQAGVLPASQTQTPCTLRTKRHLRVRARQLNTIRVRVRTDEPVAGKTVRLKLPGRKHTIKRKTNKNGVATFRVRPKRSGRATIRAGRCGRARVSVKPARRVAARRVPRVTG